MANGNLSDNTHGGGMGGNQGRLQSGGQGGRVRDDFDASLNSKGSLSKQQDMTVIGTTEGISTLPSDPNFPDSPLD
jgi:hypothetical protein